MFRKLLLLYIIAVLFNFQWFSKADISLVLEDKCTSETLQDIVDRNFNNNFDFLFEGTSVPEAKAYCCNQSFCNFNATFAILNESPSSAEPLQQDIGIALDFSLLALFINSILILNLWYNWFSNKCSESYCYCTL